MVFAWTEPNPSNDTGLNLFIGAKGKIEAKNCAGLFEGCEGTAEEANFEALR